ncbi:hypothetical protein EJ357_46065 [Streptomyces cyaneochromogenes]|uniref:Uncharacterized protein n=1 Tax=Streptomyces cyaneochromogenes TaxID=2496836 RepID=A0A3S9MKZ7_9ACTN|nr:hypothetical protein EJ357_46065 [Streptomyces cyaneochromogenes]
MTGVRGRTDSLTGGDTRVRPGIPRSFGAAFCKRDPGTSDLPELEGNGGVDDPSSAVQAAVPFTPRPRAADAAVGSPHDGLRAGVLRHGAPPRRELHRRDPPAAPEEDPDDPNIRTIWPRWARVAWACGGAI